MQRLMLDPDSSARGLGRLNHNRLKDQWFALLIRSICCSASKRLYLKFVNAYFIDCGTECGRRLSFKGFSIMISSAVNVVLRIYTSVLAHIGGNLQRPLPFRRQIAIDYAKLRGQRK